MTISQEMNLTSLCELIFNIIPIFKIIFKISVLEVFHRQKFSSEQIQCVFRREESTTILGTRAEAKVVWGEGSVRFLWMELGFN